MLNGIKKVSAITVQKVHGATQSISRLKAKNPKAQIETMEAASAWFACNNKGISYIGIRSISNYVEPRNRDSWKIEEAINTLNIFLLKFLEEILSSTSAK
jgi:futalosine hydrolase